MNASFLRGHTLPEILAVNTFRSNWLLQRTLISQTQSNSSPWDPCEEELRDPLALPEIRGQVVLHTRWSFSVSCQKAHGISQPQDQSSFVKILSAITYLKSYFSALQLTNVSQKWYFRLWLTCSLTVLHFFFFFLAMLGTVCGILVLKHQTVRKFSSSTNTFMIHG